MGAPSQMGRAQRVQAFSPQAETLAWGEFTSPEHLKSKGLPRGPPRGNRHDRSFCHRAVYETVYSHGLDGKIALHSFGIKYGDFGVQ